MRAAAEHELDESVSMVWHHGRSGAEAARAQRRGGAGAEAARRCMKECGSGGGGTAVRGGGAWLACLAELWVALVGSVVGEAPPVHPVVVANERLIAPFNNKMIDIHR